MRVVGIDPGTAITGWAVVEAGAARPLRLASGALRLRSSMPLAARLHRIHGMVRDLLLEHRPGALSLEKAFVARNPQSALRLGEARGAVMVAAAECGVEVFEYAPAEVKRTLVGYGRAEKDQMIRGVAMLFAIAEPTVADEADALAVAACHLSGSRLRDLVERAR